VETAIHDYGRFTNLRTVVLFGGTGYGRQDQALRQGADILVATPGRLLDQMQRGMVRLNQIEVLVLDEADRMLDMGFLPDVRRIVERCPRARQTMLFSATIPPEIDQLCKWALRNPETVEIGQRRSPAATVTHALYPVASDQKQALLEELLKRTDYDQVLIFCRTKNGADRVARKLHHQGHAVAVLHSNRTQRERERALEGFRNGRYEVMVATDIASRGIDVEQISHVINFDVPHHPEDYVHRIGRTGRAQSVGDAFTIITGEDVQEVAAIERFIGQKIPRVKLEGFAYEYTRLLENNPPPAFGAKRRRGSWSFGYGSKVRR
jgi:ATP-dependent RNA helicase RhlE